MQVLSEIRQHPRVNLIGHGKNPAGLPMFRVVWSPTRLSRVYDNDSYQTVRMYEKSAWLLERWVAPEDYIGGDEAHYLNSQQFRDAETGALPLGPYPREGEYFGVFEFPSEDAVTQQNAMLIVKMLRKGVEEMSAADRMAALRLQAESEDREQEAKIEAIMLDARHAPGSRVAEKVRLYGPNGQLL